MQTHLDALHRGVITAVDEGGGQNLYALLGSLKGLLNAIEDLQDSMHEINWEQWSAARF